MSRIRRLAVRSTAVAATALVSVLLIAGTASAHVTVSSPGATQGGYAKLTFRVPNETDDTDTTKVQVFFPQDQPLASVSIQPLTGWTYRVKTTRLETPIESDDGQVTQAVSEVVWTADSRSTAIKPGEFEEFNVSAGPLPKAPTMVFKALQTYSDGTIVRWIDLPAGGEEPEHPAPTLQLATASADQGHDPPTAATTSGSGSGRATAALVLSIAALVVALGAAAASLLRRSRA